MTVIQTIILSVVEGITEFLPVSSTGHLILTGTLLGIQQSDFIKSFDIAIQLGAILSVVVLYGKRLISDLELWKKVFVAFVPTAIIGFALYKVLKQFLLQDAQLVVWALALGGLALIFFEIWYKRTTPDTGNVGRDISYKQAFLIGLAQSLAIIPGVSRSGATVVGGMLMGVGRVEIVEFSFLLAIPTMAAATGYDLLKSAPAFTSQELPMLLLGFIISFLVALVAVKWLIGYVKKNTFTGFGWYRIVIALAFWALVIR